MNIIFLDVDGVLNSTNKLKEVYNKTNKPHSGFDYPFDEKCLENLKLLVKLTDSKLVITSSWRKSEQGKKSLLNMLEKYDLKKDVIGFTPILYKKRGKEIEEYLSTLSCKPNFIILDDNTDMGDLLPYLIKTNNQFGLTKENIKKGMIKLLKIK